MPGSDPRFAGLRNVTDSGTVTVWLTGTGRGMPVTRTTSLRHCPWPGATAASEWGRRGPQQQPHHSRASAVARVRWLVVRSSCLVLLLPLAGDSTAPRSVTTRTVSDLSDLLIMSGYGHGSITRDIV